MLNKPFFETYSATSSCVLRLGEGTKDCGQKPDPNIGIVFYGDSWFEWTSVAVREHLDSAFLGPVKTSHGQFPKKFLEETMKDWPPGSHLVMETTVRDNKYYGIG